jgi:hypothetical protein
VNFRTFCFAIWCANAETRPPITRPPPASRVPPPLGTILRGRRGSGHDCPPLSRLLARALPRRASAAVYKKYQRRGRRHVVPPQRQHSPLLSTLRPFAGRFGSKFLVRSPNRTGGPPCQVRGGSRCCSRSSRAGGAHRWLMADDKELPLRQAMQRTWRNVGACRSRWAGAVRLRAAEPPAGRHPQFGSARVLDLSSQVTKGDSSYRTIKTAGPRAVRQCANLSCLWVLAE